MASDMDRRSFLKIGAVGATGFAQGIPTASLAETKISADKDPGVRQYVELGKTGLRISDISFGSSQIKAGEESLVRHALAKGVNYFDTAEDYARGISEPVLGRALKGERDKVVIGTKTKAYATTRASDLMRSLETSLTRLQTDYIDIIKKWLLSSGDLFICIV